MKNLFLLFVIFATSCSVRIEDRKNKVDRPVIPIVVDNEPKMQAIKTENCIYLIIHKSLLNGQEIKNQLVESDIAEYLNQADEVTYKN
jgi:hypothetical protein